MMRGMVLFLLSFTLLAGCQFHEQGASKTSNETFTTRNPAAEDILSQRPDADFFQWNGIVYVNANHLEWVLQAELTIGPFVGNITKQYKEGLAFEDEMATKLPVGTEIYEPAETNGPILFVKFHGKAIPYLGLIEG